jgi:GNAT superfamily N-acetyltransferase
MPGLLIHRRTTVFFDREWHELTKNLQDEPENWWVAVDNGKVVGIMWLSYEIGSLGPYASVGEIDVHPAFRNSGIGTKLLAKAEELVRSSDAVMLLIGGFISNPAIRLYRQVGFVDFPDVYREDKNPNHVVLWKPLKLQEK